MLLYFLLGVLFTSLGLSIIEALSSIISAWSEYIVYKLAFKVYKIKIQMGEKEEEEQEASVIGFTTAIGEQIPVDNIEQEE